MMGQLEASQDACGLATNSLRPFEVHIQRSFQNVNRPKARFACGRKVTGNTLNIDIHDSGVQKPVEKDVALKCLQHVVVRSAVRAPLTIRGEDGFISSGIATIL